MAVGRRVAGSVGRNRLKRRIRNWFRLRRSTLPLGSDLVIVVRRGAAELDSQQLGRELEELLR